MTFNTAGLLAALAAFFGIWFGHVAVRRIEWGSSTIGLPTTVFALAGLILEYVSIRVNNQGLAIVTGIIGITLLWDALEFTRQQNRIKKGHAPANLNNPRHLRLMEEYAGVTPLDLLKREPVGRAVSEKEAIHLMMEHRAG